LRRRRGDELFGAAAQVRDSCDAIVRTSSFMHLSGTPEVIGKRQASRPGHFMPASLLASQLPRSSRSSPMKAASVIDVDQNIDSIIDNYVALSATRTTEQENR